MLTGLELLHFKDLQFPSLEYDQITVVLARRYSRETQCDGSQGSGRSPRFGAVPLSNGLQRLLKSAWELALLAELFGAEGLGLGEEALLLLA